MFGCIPGDDGEAAAKLLARCKIKLDMLEKWIHDYNDGAHPNMMAALLDYKAKTFAVETVEEYHQDQEDKELGFKERSLADWKKIFKFAVVDGAIRISGYKGEETVIEVPRTIDGKPVKFIHDKAFQNCKTAVSIFLPDGITEIGKSAFSGCVKLENMTLPDSVTVIGNSAFASCESLERMVIPRGVTAIVWYAFSNCLKLTDITMPESIQEIGSYAFLCCESLTRIVIPNGVKKLGSDVVAGCSNLVDITI